VNFPKPILANTAVTRSNIYFIMRGRLYGSRQHREIPRPRFAPLGMTREEIREWLHGSAGTVRDSSTPKAPARPATAGVSEFGVQNEKRRDARMASWSQEQPETLKPKSFLGSE